MRITNTKIKRLEYKKSGLSEHCFKTLEKLNTPQKVQDYLNGLPFNFEKSGETYMSVERSIASGTVHCFEGALIAAAALWIQGLKPFIVDLLTSKDDIDHVIAVFKDEASGKWGAISKTNHSVLRYREPVYVSIRELAMSYFHEYFLEDGSKSLRSYSDPLDLSKLGKFWLSAEEDLDEVVFALEDAPHHEILSKTQIKNLRKADELEVKASLIEERGK